jgi:N-hydroxyarylamine O-acetyltransferase
MTLDLPAYLERIEWSGALRQDHATLAALLDAHMAHIPFENLDVLLGRGIRIDLASIQDKLVGARRGGYCFEHATLFAAVLDATGFAPARHIARVVMVLPRETSPRTHMFLTVSLPEGTFVVDPGFGSLAPRVPVPLREDRSAAGRDIAHRMQRDGDGWVLKAEAKEKTVDCWYSPLERDPPIDFEVGNHFTATHPSSPFVNRILLRALTRDGRVSVMNRDVTIRRGEAIETVELADRAALRHLLNAHFGFDLPEAAALRVPSIPEWR